MPYELRDMPPIEILKRYFRVDSEGRIQRKTAKHGWKQVSRIRAGGTYSTVCFEGKKYLTHRMVWALHHGRHPEGLIDHINGKKWENHPENLREATPAQNRWNRPPAKNSRSGARGVIAVKGGYRGRTTVKGATYMTPVFRDPELAELGASVLRDRLHGEFAWRSA